MFSVTISKASYEPGGSLSVSGTVTSTSRGNPPGAITIDVDSSTGAGRVVTNHGMEGTDYSWKGPLPDGVTVIEGDQVEVWSHRQSHAKAPIALKKSLAFTMEHQTQVNWCWAAVGASVGNFFWGTGTYTQCEIANTCQQKTTCCTSPGGCNQYGWLEKALAAAKSFDRYERATIEFAALQSQINSEKLIGTRVKWNSGGAHFMVISGYDTDGDTIEIKDPWYGTSVMVFASYPASYHGGGTWTTTYYTEKN